MATSEDKPEENPYITDPDTAFEAVGSLSEADAREQAAQLREAIRFHDYKYYVEADPVIGDRTYDALFTRLQELEETFELPTANSPTQRVGGPPIDELETAEHVEPMLSLDQSGEAEEVRAFDERVRERLTENGYSGEVEYFCEPKFDGLSVEVVYEDGVYHRAVTRGDGDRGDDVTEQVRTIPTVPQQLRGEHPDSLAVRGEVFMPREGFQELNRERVERGEEPFANPRNAAAGSLRQLDPSVVADRPLSIFFFSILDADTTVESNSAVYEVLPAWGLRVSERAEHVPEIEAAIEYRDRMLGARERLDYEIDGVVIAVDDRSACELLGSTSRAPRWAFAYKFPARSEQTTVRDIVVQVGRTGRLTPVALLDPVEVGGVTVSRASLHNPEEIARLGVDLGDQVRVERAGDVIPDVTAVIDEATQEHYSFPDQCPACGEQIERDGPLAFCPAGLGCPAQREQAIEHYGSRDALDIEGLGEQRVTQLVKAGLASDLADLYSLTVEELAQLDGWGEQSAQNLIQELDESREPPLADFLTALGIPGVGSTTARSLATQFGSVETVRTATEDQLQDVPDVGPTVAAGIREFFDTKQNRAVLDRLLEHVDPQTADTEAGDALSGVTIVFTGSLDGMTRTEAKEIVERHGGAATSSVSGNTDYLVVGENPGQTKRDDAEANDVPMLSPAEFSELLADRGIALD